MKAAELRQLLDRLGVHPSRKLGQNFLVDENMLDALVKAAAPQSAEKVLEIGPGTGVLTRRLLDAGCQLTAVELDHRLAEYLRQEFADRQNFTIIEGDACKIDYSQLFPADAFRCLANLPYSCGSVFLAKCADLDNPPADAFVLLQKEMGDRLTASVGTKDYGALTVRLAWLYEISLVRLVPPGVFLPPPEVMSAYIRLKRKDDFPDATTRRLATKVTLTAFAQRRKKAAGLLESIAPKQQILTAFQALNIPLDARAENITPKQFLALAKYFALQA